MIKVDFEAAIKALNMASHYDALWECFISSLIDIDVDLITYHHIAPNHAPDAGRIDILKYGYPQAWHDYCAQNELAAHDPIFNMGYTRTDSFRWGEVLDPPHHDELEKKFAVGLKEWMKGDGYMIPVFGPSGRNGYIAAGNLASIQEWGTDCLQKIKLLSQEFHIRYVALRLSELPSEFSLDEQEHAILNGAAAGRSTHSIAKSMGLKPADINAALDKLMLTMSISDLPSLIIRAKSLGLIKAE